MELNLDEEGVHKRVEGLLKSMKTVNLMIITHSPPLESDKTS